MSEERFWNTDEYASTAKFAVHDGAMTMRQAGRIFRLDPAPPKVEEINDYIVSAVRENDLNCFTYFLHYYEPKLNKRVYRFLLTEGIDRYDPLRFLDYKLSLTPFFRKYKTAVLSILARMKITAAFFCGNDYIIHHGVSV